MEAYSYKILDTNELTHTIVVQYTPIDTTLSEISLNIPAPVSLDNIEAHINTYAPQSTWYNIKNPSYQLSSLVGNENTVDPTLFVEPTTTSASITGGVYELMLQLNNEFLAEQSNTVSV
jgi:hypothetical protein